MKKLLHVSTLVLSVVIIALSSCKKEEEDPAPTSPTAPPDTTPPVITIAGGNSQSQMEPFVAGTGVWVNPAATAIDLVSGDVSASIVVTGVVDPNTLGFDTLYYTAEDAAGNSNTDTLIVEITPYAHLAPYLAGYYNAADTCTITAAYLYGSAWTLSNTVNNVITINNFGAFGTAINVQATVDTLAQTISFSTPFALFSSASVTAATGAYTHNGNNVHAVIEYTWTDGMSSESCVSTYTK